MNEASQDQTNTTESLEAGTSTRQFASPSLTRMNTNDCQSKYKNTVLQMVFFVIATSIRLVSHIAHTLVSLLTSKQTTSLGPFWQEMMCFFKIKAKEVFTESLGFINLYSQSLLLHYMAIFFFTLQYVTMSVGLKTKDAGCCVAVVTAFLV